MARDREVSTMNKGPYSHLERTGGERSLEHVVERPYSVSSADVGSGRQTPGLLRRLPAGPSLFSVDQWVVRVRKICERGGSRDRVVPVSGRRVGRFPVPAYSCNEWSDDTKSPHVHRVDYDRSTFPVTREGHPLVEREPRGSREPSGITRFVTPEV